MGRNRSLLKNGLKTLMANNLTKAELKLLDKVISLVQQPKLIVDNVLAQTQMIEQSQRT